MRQHDVIVIGGGVIGLSAAWRLAQQGVDVLLLERGRLGREASSAAAGMLGAQSEAREDGAFYDLLVQSRSLYPRFAQELLEDSGIDIELNQNGIVRLATSSAEVSALQQRGIWQRRHGERAQWLTAAELMEREPCLATEYGGLWLPDDGNVAVPRLTQALAIAAGRQASIEEGVEVLELQVAQSSVLVRTPRADYAAERVVVAAGAWAEQLLQPLGCAQGIYPVKGQVLALRPPHTVRLSATVFGEQVYLVPKRDGRIVVGATEEPDANFTKSITAQGVRQLLSAAMRVLPQLSEAELLATWSGLRPASRQGRPFIGALPGCPQVIAAVGHYRNGILLTPVTARLVAAAVCAQSPASFPVDTLSLAVANEEG